MAKYINNIEEQEITISNIYIDLELIVYKSYYKEVKNNSNKVLL